MLIVIIHKILGSCYAGEKTQLIQMWGKQVCYVLVCTDFHTWCDLRLEAMLIPTRYRGPILTRHYLKQVSYG